MVSDMDSEGFDREVSTIVSFVATNVVEFPSAIVGSGGLIEPREVLDCVALDTFTEFDSKLIELPKTPVEADATVNGIWGKPDASEKPLGICSRGDSVTALLPLFEPAAKYPLFVLANAAELDPRNTPPKPSTPKILRTTINRLLRRNIKLLIFA